MRVLGIETSCDETSAAVVRDGYDVLSNVVSSQVDLHRTYGGVVPELASRNHLENLPRVIQEALQRASCGWDEIDAVAATYGPGLASSLLVGFSMAKGLALRLGKPLVAVNHLEAHVHSAFFGAQKPRFEEVCPFFALVVSGGHTLFLRAEGLGQYRLLGQTIDDAAGEAFDKGANLLGLGYPGGPAIDKISRGAAPGGPEFPRGRVRKGGQARSGGLDTDVCVSYSGLKTALLYYLRDNPVAAGSPEVASIAAGYQEAIVDTLLDRCGRAFTDERCLVAGGGVTLNSRLRARLKEFAERQGVRILLAEPAYCGDNAAMIAGVAGVGQWIRGDQAFSLDVDPSLRFGG